MWIEVARLNPKVNTWESLVSKANTWQRCREHCGTTPCQEPEGIGRGKGASCYFSVVLSLPITPLRYCYARTGRVHEAYVTFLQNFRSDTSASGGDTKCSHLHSTQILQSATRPLAAIAGRAFSYLSCAIRCLRLCRRRTACCHEKSDREGGVLDQLLRAGAREPEDLVAC